MNLLEKQLIYNLDPQLCFGNYFTAQESLKITVLITNMQQLFEILSVVGNHGCGSRRWKQKRLIFCGSGSTLIKKTGSGSTLIKKTGSGSTLIKKTESGSKLESD